MTTYLTQPLTEEVRSRIVSNLDRVLRLTEEGQVLCDFCGEDDPSLMYAVSQLTMGTKAPNWLWCSCERCSMLVKVEDWRALRELMYKCYERPLQRVFRVADTTMVRKAIECSLFDFLICATKAEVDH